MSDALDSGSGSRASARSNGCALAAAHDAANQRAQSGAAADGDCATLASTSS